MARHVVVVDRKSDFAFPADDRHVVTAKDFLLEPPAPGTATARVINLCRDYSYLSLGYYCSLLAEARGQKVIPSVESMLDLHWKRLLRIGLPEVNALVRRTFKGFPDGAGERCVTVFFGVSEEPSLADAARRVFELFRCPILSLDLRQRRGGWEIAALAPVSIRELTEEQAPMFAAALDRYTRRAWRRRPVPTSARYSLAILHDPAEELPPSDPTALRRFVRAGSALGVEIELITRTDYGRLLEFDALFIRETTALDDHTYRFAKKAETEGLPVMDDPLSILRCTNKVYLAELLQANGIPTPRTLILDKSRIRRIERDLGYPAVVKVPDGSFSRGVFKVTNRAELDDFTARVFDDSDLAIAQEFMPTKFDWRVGVLNRRPIFVCQYFMAKNHWQIVKHDGAEHDEGRFRTLAVTDAPARVIDVATRAASLIGDGLYGVDLKETDDGVYVVEVNDNPNIDGGVEDAVLKDGLYRLIVEEFVRRLEKRVQPQAREGRR